MNERRVRVKFKYPRSKREVFENNLRFTLRPREPRCFRCTWVPFKQHKAWMPKRKSPFVQRTLMRRLSQGSIFGSTLHKRWARYVPCNT